MNPQLQTVIDEFRSATERLERLRGSLSSDQWGRRPEPTRWSPAECVAHLNLTAEAFLPVIAEAIRDAEPASSEVRFRRDVTGWMLWKMLAPPVRFRTKTAPSFVPTADDPPEMVIDRFLKYQHEQIAMVERCDGLRIDRVKMRSPFDARVKYNIYSALTILPVHQHRHLWQAGAALRN